MPLLCTLNWATGAAEVRPQRPWNEPPSTLSVRVVVTGLSKVYGGPDSLTLIDNFSVGPAWPTTSLARLSIDINPKCPPNCPAKLPDSTVVEAAKRSAKCSATYRAIAGGVAARPLQP